MLRLFSAVKVNAISTSNRKTTAVTMRRESKMYEKVAQTYNARVGSLFPVETLSIFHARIPKLFLNQSLMVATLLMLDL